MDGQNSEIYLAVITIVTGLIAILTIFVIFVVVTQRRLIALQKKLLRAEILSIEKERERVASDLHDTLGSTLYGLAALTEQVQTANETSAQLNKEITQNLRDANEMVRQISRDLIPRFYEETTVQEVIQKAAADFQLLCEKKGIQLIVRGDAQISLSKENHLHLFRIVHELVNNGYKHSGAGIINLSCFLKEGVLLVSYNDNGIGYDKEVMENGLGLSNIQNRMNLLNGSYSVETGKGKGTDIQLRIPV
jgi:two-component system, NarL family, sensor kinase